MKLGESFTLAKGCKATVFLDKTPLTPSAQPALYEKKPDFVPQDVKWDDYPVISLHDTAQELLSVIHQITLRRSSHEDDPSQGGGVPTWPMGALMLAGLSAEEKEEAVAALKAELGLDLSLPNMSYALVRWSRNVGTAVHPTVASGLFRQIDPQGTVRPETLRALKRLEKKKHSYEVSADGARGYIDFYKTFGSHFISQIHFGDTLFQVFSYGKEEFETIKSVYEENPDYLSGHGAQFFSQYTVKKNTAGYGYAAAIGSLCLASSDPALAETIEAGKWHDDKYALDNSIFSPYLRPDSVNVNLVFYMEVAIGIQLTSLSEFAEYYRKRIWRDLFKGVMYLRFAEGEGIVPYFSNNCPYDLSAMYKSSDIIDGDGGLLSAIATPSVNIFKEHVELTSIVLEFSELVESFHTCSNALEIALPTEDRAVFAVPGSSSIGLVSHVISAQNDGPSVPTLRISDSAYTNIKSSISCGEFFGALHIISFNGSESLVLNGLMVELVDREFEIAADFRTSLPEELLSKHLVDFQFSLVAAEARLNFLLSGTADLELDADLTLMRKYLLWLGGAAGKCGTPKEPISDLDPVSLQARALYLAKMASTSATGAGLPVPYLKYDAYKDTMTSVQEVLKTANSQLESYQSQIRARRAEERAIANMQVLNDNIIKSGKLLNDYIAAQASYQDDLTMHFTSLIADKEEELKALLDWQTSLSSMLDEQRIVVGETIESYKKAVQDWQTRKNIKAAINIAASLFTLGFSVFVHLNAFYALEDLAKTVEKVQRYVEIFDALKWAYNSVDHLPRDPEKVIEALEDIGPEGLESPNNLEWSEMEINMNATMALGPDIPAKLQLSAAFAILVLRGKALIEVQNQLQARLTELSAEYSSQRVHETQKKRLEQLLTEFEAEPENLDLAAIDLAGLSGQLVFFQRRMLMVMGSTLVIQDRCLQYEYLQPPVLVGTFSFMNLQLGILSQAQRITSGLSVQPMPMSQPEPIVFEVHGVNPDSLINNKSHSFNISINKREFGYYNYVRVEEVEADIGGIVSTNSGKYYTELIYDGDPFMDRDFNGNPATFQTVSRLYTYLDNVSNSRHSKDAVHGSKPVEASAFLKLNGIPLTRFEDKVSNITPFSSWSISLPRNVVNEGIKFDNCPRGVTIRLTFRIFAQLKLSSLTTSEMVRNAFILRTRGVVEIPPEVSRQMLGSTSRGLVRSTASVSKSHVLNSMKNKSVTAGWDVVFSLDAKQINNNLRDQFNDREGNPEFVRNTGRVEKVFENSLGYRSKTIYEFEFDAPLLQFLLNNSSSAQVTFPINKGLYEDWKESNGEWFLWNRVNITGCENYSVQGDLPLAIVQGEVSAQKDIALKLNGGKFSAQNFEPGADNPDMNNALTEYFTEDLPDGYELYKLGTLDTTGVTLLEAMTPSNFMLNVYHSPSDRDILQVFIATTGELQSDTSIFLLEPYPSDFKSSLIVSSKVVFSDVVPFSFSTAGVGLELEAVEPDNNENLDKPWSASATAGQVSGPFEPAFIDRESVSNPPGSGYRTETEHFVGIPTNTAVISIRGMKFECNDDSWDLKMSMNTTGTDYCFQNGYRERNCNDWSGCGPWSSIRFEDDKFPAKVDVIMHADLVFEVTGKGQDQSLKLSSDTPVRSLIEAHIELPGGACGCEDENIQVTLNDQLNSEIAPQLDSMLEKDFPSISLFALKNILFPAQDLLVLEEVYTPGDLIIFGNFLKEPKSE